MITVELSRYNNIVFLTGAGVSVPSGIRPFRGENGIWNEINPEKYASWDSFFTCPEETAKFHGKLKNTLIDASPNEIHRFLASIGEKHNVTIITQNIDRLHHRAGSRNVIELHGTLFETKCSDLQCRLEVFEDVQRYDGKMRYCPICGSVLRPNAVMFGELLDEETVDDVIDALVECDLFVAVGTSGSVVPASTFVDTAKANGARTMYINDEELMTPNNNFDVKIIDKAEKVLADIFIFQ